MERGQVWFIAAVGATMGSRGQKPAVNAIHG